MSLVITGSPGVGKHTIAKIIAKEKNYKILDINQIALESGLFEKKKESVDVDVVMLKKILKKKITKKSLIVGHLAPYVIPKTLVKRAIVLRKNPYKLLPIYKKRKYSKRKTVENLGSEILGIIAYDTSKKFGKSKTYQIDTSSKSSAKIKKTIKSILENKFEAEKIDWLVLISEKNDLQKFFAY